MERDKPKKKSESVGQLCRSCHGNKKGGILKKNVAAFGGLKQFKMAAVAMVTKVQNGRQIQKSSDLGEIWFPSRL